MTLPALLGRPLPEITAATPADVAASAYAAGKDPGGDTLVGRRFVVRQPARAALQLRFDFGGRQGVPVRSRMFAGVGGRAIVHDRRLLEVHGVRCVRGRPIRLAPSSLPNHPSAGMI